MRTIALSTLLGIVLLAGGIGCASEPYESDTNTISAEAKKEITNSIGEQNNVFMTSFQSGDTASFAKVYTEDGWMMPPNAEPIKGREGVKQFLSQGKEMGLGGVELTSEELFVVSDSAAIETGSYKTFAGGGQVDHGTFMVYWKKDGDTWRMYRDIWNSDMAAQNQQRSEGEQP